MTTKNAEALRRHYQKYRDRYLERNRQRKLETRALIESLKNVPCLDCGNRFPPECMDFDHVRGEKLFQIGHYNSVGKFKLMQEIEKCDIVCANCHRIRTRLRSTQTGTAA